MRKNTPMVLCTSANGGAATDYACCGDAEEPSKDMLHRGKNCEDWSKIVDEVIEQYDEALRLLGK
jgi:hypothetical protein